ncbi:hypothetical protein PHLGIDRAFT_10596 [Phlebiopsis gigantea 11061_1 CR5-6]|uniref:Uncharacterized protein n=1 Tax=Phlebiopsis gigantea (strain 11061_1 CR5-6) TaxID=745531 RepID=A0A0C3PV03_PHLG1|nr:hypothetical protein PHLGIDRAFT_10596 [Phlebiopsis gigantea 11061_1 CR5-6]
MSVMHRQNTGRKRFPNIAWNPASVYCPHPKYDKNVGRSAKNNKTGVPAECSGREGGSSSIRKEASQKHVGRTRGGAGGSSGGGGTFHIPRISSRVHAALSSDHAHLHRRQHVELFGLRERERFLSDEPRDRGDEPLLLVEVEFAGQLVSRDPGVVAGVGFEGLESPHQRP